MFTLSTLIAIAVLTFLLGGIIGSALTRTISPQQQRAKNLETKLQDSEQQLKDYQQEVTEHFAQTAKLVNNLTQSYRDVHEHLSGDALKLANVDISRQLIQDSSGSDDKLLGNSELGEGDFQPPRDWAPKAPGSAGTLSENYGLKEEQEIDHSSTKV